MTTRPEDFTVLTGLAYWCSFIKPDSFKGGPEAYKGRLLIKEDEAASLIEHLDGLVEKEKEKALAENPKRKTINIHPMYSYLDDFEGYIAVSFKQLYEVPTRDGGTWNPKIVMYDSKAKRIDTTKEGSIQEIPNGATLRVSWTPRAWFQSGTGTVGVKMSPQSCQIVNLDTSLPNGQGGNPFTAVDGGYEATETQQKVAAEDTESLYEIPSENEQTESDF